MVVCSYFKLVNGDYIIIILINRDNSLTITNIWRTW